MVSIRLKVGANEEHEVIINACALSEMVKVVVDGNVALNTSAPRPPGIAQVEVGKDEKHLLKIVPKEGIVCSLDIFVDGALVGSY